MDYCARPETLESRRRPPTLSRQARNQKPELLQVQTIIRHGARIPASPHQCWPSYQNEWNCQLEEVIAGVAPEIDDQHKTTYAFPKVYDARASLNLFNGTCSAGQLVQEGYDQLTRIGSWVAEAYFAKSRWRIPSEDSPPLIDISSSSREVPRLYFRSSDMQRTRISGAVFLSSLIRRVLGYSAPSSFRIPLHTIDLSQDYIFPNRDACPQLKIIESNAKNSDEYKKMKKRDREVLRRLETALDLPEKLEPDDFPGGLFDCFATVACSDEKVYELPEKLLPGTELSREVWLTMQDHESFGARYNDSQFAKAAVRQLTRDIRKHMKDAMEATHEHDFILWAGHDTTVLPLLLAIEGDLNTEGAWPPYASMINLELYHLRGLETYAFRFVYNGESITHRIKGCAAAETVDFPPDLCPVEAFMSATLFAVDDDTCVVTGPHLPPLGAPFIPKMPEPKGGSFVYLKGHPQLAGLSDNSLMGGCSMQSHLGWQMLFSILVLLSVGAAMGAGGMHAWKEGHRCKCPDFVIKKTIEPGLFIKTPSTIEGDTPDDEASSTEGRTSPRPHGTIARRSTQPIPTPETGDGGLMDSADDRRKNWKDV